MQSFERWNSQTDKLGDFPRRKLKWGGGSAIFSVVQNCFPFELFIIATSLLRLILAHVHEFPFHFFHVFVFELPCQSEELTFNILAVTAGPGHKLGGQDSAEQK